jgi:hypothetical protein
MKLRIVSPIKGIDPAITHAVSLLELRARRASQVNSYPSVRSPNPNHLPVAHRQHRTPGVARRHLPPEPLGERPRVGRADPALRRPRGGGLAIPAHPMSANPQIRQLCTKPFVSFARMGAARRVPAAVTEAGLVTHEHLVGAESVAVGAACRRVGDPLSVGRVHQLAQHAVKPSQPGRTRYSSAFVPRVSIGTSVNPACRRRFGCVNGLRRGYRQRRKEPDGYQCGCRRWARDDLSGVRISTVRFWPLCGVHRDSFGGRDRADSDLRDCASLQPSRRSARTRATVPTEQSC